MTDKIVLSRSEQERVLKLGMAFRDQLHQWIGGVVDGVRFSEGVSRELAMALLEAAAASLIATSETAQNESDDATGERVRHAAKAAFEVLAREVLS